MMRRWIGPILVASALACTLAAVLGMLWLSHWAPDGVQVVIDGQRWAPGELQVAHWLAITLAVAFALLAVMLVLGVVLPLVVLVVVLAVSASLGLAALSVLGVTALLLSPLWVVVLLAWLLLRRRPPQSPAAS